MVNGDTMWKTLNIQPGGCQEPIYSTFWTQKLLWMVNYLKLFLPPATKLGQGYVFTCVCDSVQRGGVCLSACWDTPPQEQTPPKQTPHQSRHPREQTPPRVDTLWADTPQEQTAPRADNTTPRGNTPREQTTPPQDRADPPVSRHPAVSRHPLPWSRHPPSPRRACWEIRSTRGRYASYWNAILFKL